MGEFIKSLAYVLENEGGLTNDAADKGGLTNFGISTPTLREYQFRSHDLSARTPANLTMEQATKIYKLLFWRFDNVLDNDVATKLFDIVVNCGMEGGMKVIQRALVNCGHFGLKVDGVFGAGTLNAINGTQRKVLFEELLHSLIDHYSAIVEHDPSQAVFIKGWLRRAHKLPAGCSYYC